MASHAEDRLVNSSNYASLRQEKQSKNKDNEIRLYCNNVLLVKAERGVTLGLIKLIYSSDENNSGILLGVKPRLVDQVPCLITFDSTPLKHDAYDLIVHDPGSGNTCEQTNEQPNRTTTNKDAPQSLPLSQTFEKDTDAHPSLMDASSTSGDWPHSSLNTSLTSSFADVQYQGNDRINETLQDAESQGSGVDVDGGNTSVSERVATSFDDETHSENPEPDSTEAIEKVQFYPEQFDFDIKSVTPLQTDNGLRWPCDRCGKHYCSTSHLKRHWILHTNFRPYKCTLCDKSFHFQWDLKRHNTKHTGNKRFKCPHCDKSFNTQKEVKCHSWLHTGRKLYKCQICDHELSSSGNLKVHMRKHTGVKPYKCEFCPRAFYMLGHYQYHKMRHTGIKPYKCDVCGKGFSYSLNLKEHNNIHTGAKPYSCPKCDKKFAHRSTLKQHILVHGGKRPYKCHICSKDFVQSSNYRNHLLTHKGKEERMQKCDLCGKELLSRRWVKKHRQRCINKLMGKTDNDKPKTPKEPKTKYKCETCSRVFTYRANFESHCKKAHKPPEEGEQQKEKKTKKTSDVRRNKVSCPICHKKFLYMKCVKKHLQKRHAGVEMAMPENMESTSSLKDSSFAITSGEDSRVIIRSNMNDNNQVTSSRDDDASSSPQVEVLPIVQPVPTIHIQPTGMQSSSQSAVTFIFVPSNTKPTSSKSAKTGKQGSIPEAHPAGQSTSSYTVTSTATSDKDKSTETGSQAITALKRLSAKVGIQEQFPCLPNTTDEQRQTVRSEHLSALEQLSKRVGDYGSVAMETVTPAPRDFVKLPEQTKSQPKADENDDESSVSKDNEDKDGDDGGKDDEEY